MKMCKNRFRDLLNSRSKKCPVRRCLESMLTMYQQITVKTLIAQGEKKKDVASQIGCHRNTVYNVLRREPIETQTRSKPSFFDTYHDTIKKYLKDDRLTRLRIYELLRDEHGVNKTYDSLCKYIQKHFPKAPEAYGVQITKPGEIAEVDFGYLGMLPGNDGKLVKAWGIAVILSFSRHGYWAVTYDQKLATLTRQLKMAFEYFGGVSRKLKVDNMKTAILKNQHYELEFNQDFLEFCAHYNTVIVPCTPCHPEQKGKVESAIKYMQRNFIAGRNFQDGRDLINQLKDWMNGYANVRTHGTTKKVPLAVYEQEEKSTMQALPDNEFAIFERVVRKVAANCHIHFENNYYSVPARLVGEQVTIRYNTSLVRIIYKSEQVALHKRVQGAGTYVTVRSHMPEYKIYSETEYQKRYEKRMAAIGEQAHIFFRMLLEHKRNYWGRIVRGVLGLANIYGKEAVEQSLQRAMHFNATDLATIRNIAEKKLYECEPEPKLSPAGNHENGRSLSYYQI